MYIYPTTVDKHDIKAGRKSYVCLAFPRSKVKDAIQKYSAYAENSAIYLYLGSASKSEVYIGQASDWSQRIVQPHNCIEAWRIKEWEYTFVFTSPRGKWDDQSRNYLEFMLYHTAMVVGNYTLKNNETPYPGNLEFKASQRRDLDKFIAEAANKLYSLDFHIFKP